MEPLETLEQEIIKLDRNENLFEHPSQVLQIFLANHYEHFAKSYSTANLQRRVHQKLLSVLTNSNGTLAAPQQSAAEPLTAEQPAARNLCLTHGAEDALLKLFLWKAPQWQQLLVPEFSWGNYQHLTLGLGFSVKYFGCIALQKPIREEAEVQEKQLEGTQADTQETPSSRCFEPKPFQIESSFDFADLRAKIAAEKGRIAVLLPSPNNPTGHVTDSKIILKLAQEFPSADFIVDGAYATYPNTFCRDLLDSKIDNCFFIGSFSKFFGFPGLRLGFIYTGSNAHLPPALELNLGFGSKNLLVAEKALENLPYYVKRWNEMLTQCNLFAKQMATIGAVVPLESYANFLTLQLPGEPINFQECVEGSRVLPKYFCFNRKHYLRWGMGPKHIYDQIHQFMNILRYKDSTDCQ